MRGELHHAGSLRGHRPFARPVRVPGAAALALAALLLAAGCGGARRADPPAPVLLLGVDGLEWGVALPLLREGRMPHLRALMARGVYGELRTFEPTLSPVIWTSIATGKRPPEHGIRHFVYRGSDGRARLFHNGHRRTKAVWNIASDYGLRVATVGWWMTYPVEPVRGLMVAQTNTRAQIDTRAGRNVWKGMLRPDRAQQVHPPERREAMMAVLERVDAELPAITESIFGRFPHPLSALGERLWRNCRWSFRADATYHRIALGELRAERAYDLMMLYLGGPDVVGHRFWRYMEPEAYAHPPSEAQVENLGSVIPHYYAWVDRALGELLEAAPEGANVLVLSDHGMHAVQRERRFDPEAPPRNVNSGHHRDAPPGVFVAAGPSIRRAPGPLPEAVPERARLETAGSVYDVAPTLLALLGVPAGEDMDGAVLERALAASHPLPAPRRVATHDSEAFLAARPRLEAERPDAEQRLEQLRALGYVSDERAPGEATGP